MDFITSTVKASLVRAIFTIDIAIYYVTIVLLFGFYWHDDRNLTPQNKFMCTMFN